MRVEQSSHVVGWENSNKVTVVKKTYHYDEGNDVTVVEKRRQSYSIYDNAGRQVDQAQLGNNIDKTV